MWDDWNAIEAAQQQADREAQERLAPPSEPIPIANARSVRQRASQPVLAAPAPIPPPVPLPLQHPVVDDVVGLRLFARFVREFVIEGKHR